MLSNGKGGLHLTAAADGWLVPGRNPFGLYFNMEDVDKWATKFRNEILGKNAPEDKPWVLMSSQSLTRTRLWPASAGRVAFVSPP